MDPGEEIAGWVIERQLGQGGMGQVYLASHPRLPRLDAVKVLNRELGGDEEFRHRFFRESELVCGLVHPHVVTVYDRGEYDGLLYFTMQYVSGGDLLQRLAEDGAIPVPVALEITRQLASALDAAHQSGLVHRDIKPANVLLMPGPADRPFAVLADFGISRAESGGTLVTSDGQILATPAYAAPETARGEHVDGRADQYALGCMLFELLSGEVPFRRDTPIASLIAHVNDPVPALGGDPQLSRALAPVFERVLAKQPGDRYASCQDFADAAAAAVTADTTPIQGGKTTNLVTSPSTPAEPAAPTIPPAAPRRRRRWVWGMALVAVAAIVAGVLVGISQGGSKPSTHALPPAAGYTPQFVADTCSSEVNIPGASCGTLTVPQDRSKPTGAKVTLAVTRAPARGKVTSAPVVDFGSDDLSDSLVRDHAEEIQVSRRGFAPSTPVLTCPEYAKIAPASLSQKSGATAVETQRRNALQACFARLQSSGVDPNMFTYYTDADDMLDLLRALRLPRVNVAGRLTDSVSILELDRLAPQAVATVSLQDPVVAGESSSTDPTQYLATAFDSYSKLCAADSGCRAFGDLRALYAKLFASYQAAPSFALGDNNAGTTQRVLVDGARVAQGIAAEMDDPRALPLLASAIAHPRSAMLDRLLADGVIAYEPGVLDPDYPWGAVLSEECSYDVFTVSQAHGLASDTRLELSGVDETGAFDCGAWKVSRLPATAFNAALAMSAPTLIAQGALSPFTTPTWGPQLARETFSNASVATFPTLGSLVASNAPRCLSDLRRQLIAQGKIPDGVSACAAASRPITFVTPAG
ncbi:MAG TPA: serine/threonine-protein kinase [Frankiaceae bacterium]|nr:serine/threonine-protein kinase [Frankiaceae bacterium]